MLSAAVLWAVSGVVARSLFQRAVDPVHLVQVRMVLGGLALLPLVLRRGAAIPPLRALPGLAAYALGLTAVQLTYFEAVAAAGVATAIFLQYTSPLIVSAWEAVRARRVPSPSLCAALLAGTAGSALLVLPARSGALSPAGLAWGVASAVAMAANTVLAGRQRRRGVGATPLLAFGLLAGSLLFLPVRTPWSALAAIPRPDLPYFLYVAVFATAVPFTLYAAALAVLPGSVAMLLAMLEPVCAATLAWVALGDALSGVQLAGGAFILVAVALAARAER